MARIRSQAWENRAASEAGISRSFPGRRTSGTEDIMRLRFIRRCQIFGRCCILRRTSRRSIPRSRSWLGGTRRMSEAGRKWPPSATSTMRTRSIRAAAKRLASARCRTRETQPEAGGRSRLRPTTGVGEGACQAGVGQEPAEAAVTSRILLALRNRTLFSLEGHHLVDPAFRLSFGPQLAPVS